MKLHISKPSGVNVFSGYGEGFVMVGERRISHSVIVLPERIVEDWDATRFEALTASHLEALADLDCEVVLLGTGSRLRFPPPGVLRQANARLAAAGAGLEIMDVQAACRTYNILVAEERKVAAALLLG